MLSACQKGDTQADDVEWQGIDWKTLAAVTTIQVSHYGILTPNDYAREVDVFDEADTLRWLCVPTSHVYLGCTSDGIDESTGEHYASVEFTVEESQSLIHHFGHRRGTDMEGCLSYVRAWTRVMEGQQHVCILGSVPRTHIETWRGQPVLEYSWLVYRVKTKKACDEWGTDFDCNIKIPQDLKHAPGTVSHLTL